MHLQIATENWFWYVWWTFIYPKYILSIKSLHIYRQILQYELVQSYENRVCISISLRFDAV